MTTTPAGPDAGQQQHTNRYAAHGMTHIDDEQAEQIDEILSGLRHRIYNEDAVGPYGHAYLFMADVAWALNDREARELYAEDVALYRVDPRAHEAAYRRLWDALDASGRRPQHPDGMGPDEDTDPAARTAWELALADSAAWEYVLPESAGFIETAATAVLVRDKLSDRDFRVLTSAWLARGLPLPVPVPPVPAQQRGWQRFSPAAIATRVLFGLAFAVMLVLVATGKTNSIENALGTGFTGTELIAAVGAGGAIFASVGDLPAGLDGRTTARAPVRVLVHRRSAGLRRPAALRLRARPVLRAPVRLHRRPPGPGRCRPVTGGPGRRWSAACATASACAATPPSAGRAGNARTTGPAGTAPRPGGPAAGSPGGCTCCAASRSPSSAGGAQAADRATSRSASPTAPRPSARSED